jgi:hypothetical protein
VVGLGVAALSAGALVMQLPVPGAAMALTVLSLGSHATPPLFARIVTSLNPKGAGQGIGLNVLTLFGGFGIRSLLSGQALRWDFPVALELFVTVQVVVALAAFRVFRCESRFAR